MSYEQGIEKAIKALYDGIDSRGVPDKPVARWVVEAFLSAQRDDWFCEKHGARGSVNRCRLKKFMPQIADCEMTGVWIVERETP